MIYIAIMSLLHIGTFYMMCIHITKHISLHNTNCWKEMWANISFYRHISIELLQWWVMQSGRTRVKTADKSPWKIVFNNPGTYQSISVFSAWVGVVWVPKSNLCFITITSTVTNLKKIPNYMFVPKSTHLEYAIGISQMKGILKNEFKFCLHDNIF